MHDEEILAVMQASTGRRILGVGCLGVLGALLIWIGLTRPFDALGWQAFIVLLGAAGIWMADAMRRATSERIELTRDTLRSSDGELIARIGEIETMDRGLFAFKPSNGFLLKAKTKAPARWRPGLWWRMGRRIGLGGVTPGHQSKVMSEMIAALMAERA
ncbi:MAG: hypothetical protein ACE369_14260 [Roseovarius sp.]